MHLFNLEKYTFHFALGLSSFVDATAADNRSSTNDVHSERLTEPDTSISNHKYNEKNKLGVNDKYYSCGLLQRCIITFK